MENDHLNQNNQREIPIEDSEASSQAESSTPAEGATPEDSLENSSELDASLPESLKELVEKAAKADEYWDRLVRLQAEFENYKKRSLRDQTDAIKYANRALLERLLPTMDHFEMAMAAVNQAQPISIDSLKQGIIMVHQQLKNTLMETGLEEIDAMGKDFDPNLHEAVSQVETTDVEEGKVVNQLRKGYKLADRLLRPATVVVAKKPEVASSDTDS